jgi:SagB-type dehydrogenase family enzyme
MTADESKIISLPRPFFTGGLPLAEAITQRRSIRDFAPSPIQLFQISQILWAAQGITSTLSSLRAIPSAGSTYPLEVYLVTGDNSIENFAGGVYHYEVAGHVLSSHLAEDVRVKLADAALGQDSISVAPVDLIICAVYDRTLMRYNVRGERYVFMEAGHAGQNIYLQATALGLGTVVIGAFRDEEVRRVLQLDPGVRPLYIMPIGKPV